MTNRQSLKTALPLFLVIFIDGMGLGLLFPILNSIIIDPTSNFLATSYSLNTRQFLYGFTVAIFMLSWFFGAAILGDISDIVGRKKSLLVCLIGSFLGYLLSAFAVIINSLVVLILGRVIAGFTAGSQPIAQAAIVDISSDEHKARNIGLILFASSLGFVAGPICGGILSDPSIAHWFGYSTPLFFAAFISLVNAILLWMLFAETHEIMQKIKIQYSRAIHVFIAAFQHEKIRNLSFVLLVMIAGWSNYFTFIPMYLTQNYHFTAMHVSLTLALLGVGFGIGCGLLVDYCAKRYSLRSIVIVNLLIVSLCIILLIVVPSGLLTALCNVPVGTAMGIAYSSLLNIFSNEVGEDEQGWVMGVTGSVMALCFGVSAFFSGMIVTLGVTIPLIMSFIFIAISAAMLKVLKT